MSMYGINAYNSSRYTALYSKLNSSAKSNLSSSSSSSSSTSSSTSNDLLSLMKKVDEVRSQKYQKSMLAEYKKAFSGDQTGTAESETSLATTANELDKSATALASGDKTLYSDSTKLSDSVQSFVDDYNSTIDALKGSDSIDALRKGVYMTNTAKAYSRSLSKIGISVGSDNKLSLNKDTLAAADTNTVKSLLSGNYSFTNKTADKAGSINRAASLKAQVTYTSQGLLDYYTNNNSSNSLSSFFNSLI